MRHQMGQQYVVDIAPVVHHEHDARVFDNVLVQGRETSSWADPDVVERSGDPGRQRNADPEVEEGVERRYDLTGVALDPGHRDRHGDTVLTGVDPGGLAQPRVVGKAVDQSPAPGQLEGRQLDAPAPHLLDDPVGPLPEEPPDRWNELSGNQNCAEQEYDKGKPTSPSVSFA